VADEPGDILVRQRLLHSFGREDRPLGDGQRNTHLAGQRWPYQCPQPLISTQVAGTLTNSRRCSLEPMPPVTTVISDKPAGGPASPLTRRHEVRRGRRAMRPAKTGLDQLAVSTRLATVAYSRMYVESSDRVI
jgi:hypothetical protein